MNIQSHTRMDQTQIKPEGRERPMRDKPVRDKPVNAGLWKLLVAAVLILLGLVGVLKFFGNGEAGFTSPNPPQAMVIR